MASNHTCSSAALLLPGSRDGGLFSFLFGSDQDGASSPLLLVYRSIGDDVQPFHRDGQAIEAVRKILKVCNVQDSFQVESYSVKLF